MKNETCQGGKKSKQKVIVLFCCNADGSEKIEVDGDRQVLEVEMFFSTAVISRTCIRPTIALG